MLLHSTTWSKPVLGIIQPWDPDYDVKYGVNFQLNQSSSVSLAMMNDMGKELTIANVLICVDGGDRLDCSIQSIGGWAPQGTIFPGVGFGMALIGKRDLLYISHVMVLIDSLSFRQCDDIYQRVSGTHVTTSAQSHIERCSIDYETHYQCIFLLYYNNSCGSCNAIEWICKGIKLNFLCDGSTSESSIRYLSDICCLIYYCRRR